MSNNHHINNVKKQPKKKEKVVFGLKKKNYDIDDDDTRYIEPRRFLVVDKRNVVNVDRRLILEKLKRVVPTVGNEKKINDESGEDNDNFERLKVVDLEDDRNDLVEVAKLKEIEDDTHVDPVEPIIIKKKKKKIIINEDEPEIIDDIVFVKKTDEKEEHLEQPEEITEDELDVEKEAKTKTDNEERIVIKKKRGRPAKNKNEEPVTEEHRPPQPTKKTTKKNRVPFQTEKGFILDPAIKINKKLLINRLPKREEFKLKTSTFYMNNRKKFIQNVNTLFRQYSKEIKENVNRREKDRLFIHQAIVRDYVNLITPYRGLLLYHGLGSGKTCASIAIAEGMKNEKNVVLLVPASLKTNFLNDIKKCGDDFYKKIQYWEFISIEGKPDYVDILSNVLSISKEFIRKKGGVWLLDVSKKESNYSSLSTQEQYDINEQLDLMIESKYTYLNYVNGINGAKFREITQNYTVNPFDGKTIIIEESHNFVSRIVNKLNNGLKMGEDIEKMNISLALYHYLMSATNAKVIFLSGTPIINYPNEIAVMFNILRGYIKTWTFQLSLRADAPPGFKISRDEIVKFFERGGLKTFDFIEYSGNKLIITRNPYGFVNIYKEKEPDGDKAKTKKRTKDERYVGVSLDETGNISDSVFINMVQRILDKNHIDIMPYGNKIENNKCLPDNFNDFIDLFIGENNMLINENVFKKRILGLTSYFKTASESLLPSLIKTAEDDSYHIEMCEMSSYQFGVYEKIRKEEAESEKRKRVKKIQKAKKGEDFQIPSTYRIFSRTVCNFAFPTPPGRPMPGEARQPAVVAETEDNNPPTRIEQLLEEEIEIDVDIEAEEDRNYQEEIKSALDFLKENQNDYLVGENLAMYSPKFKKVLENIKDPANKGCHLLYSQFRVLEGIGILKLVLEANGFIEFKIKKTSNSWDIDFAEEDIGKPCFVLYTGTETVEEKEIVRNIYNSNWDVVPSAIVTKIKAVSPMNYSGEIIKLFMVTSSGTEGINLRNTRFVHIVEPYWNMVRLEQVVGRARRINSHIELLEEDRTVKAFLYISTFSNEQKTNKKNIELMIHDVSRFTKNKSITTDEYLYEIATSKHRINSKLLKSIKETAIDCAIYNKNEEGLKCYEFGNVTSEAFSSFPFIDMDKGEIEERGKTETIHLKLTKEINGVRYAVDPKTLKLYDLDSYEHAKEGNGNLVEVGKLVKEKTGVRVIFL